MTDTVQKNPFEHIANVYKRADGSEFAALDDLMDIEFVRAAWTEDKVGNVKFVFEVEGSTSQPHTVSVLADYRYSWRGLRVYIKSVDRVHAAKRGRFVDDVDRVPERTFLRLHLSPEKETDATG